MSEKSKVREGKPLPPGVSKEQIDSYPEIPKEDLDQPKEEKE